LPFGAAENICTTVPGNIEWDIMPKRKMSWIVVADGSHARILTNRGPGTGLTLLTEHHAPDARAHTAELGTERPGRSHDSTTPARHAMEPRVDWQRQEKERFVAKLADELTAARDQFDALVLVAPPRVMGELRRELNGMKDKISAELPKDLTWVSIPELGGHLDEIVKL
jgi:protein required for attachment to host cells